MFMSQKHKTTGDSGCICIDPSGISQPLCTPGFLMENYWETSAKWNKFCSPVIFQKRKTDCNTAEKNEFGEGNWNRPKDVKSFFHILDSNSIIQFDTCTRIKQKYFSLTLIPSCDLRLSLCTKNTVKKYSGLKYTKKSCCYLMCCITLSRHHNKCRMYGHNQESVLWNQRSQSLSYALLCTCMSNWTCFARKAFMITGWRESSTTVTKCGVAFVVLQEAGISEIHSWYHCLTASNPLTLHFSDLKT